MIRTKITINGTEFIDYKNLTINKTMSVYGATSSFNLLFDSPFGRHKTDFNVNNEIKIYANQDADPTTNIFTGIVEEVKFDGEETTQECTLTGRDYTARLMDVTVEPSVYSDSEISTIVKDIVANYTQDITTTNVDVTSTTLSRIAFNHLSVFEAIKQLSELSGFYFYVDENKDLHFEELETTSSGVVLDNSNILKATFSRNREGMANKIWIYGDRQLTTAPTETFALGATPGSSFILAYQPHNTQVRTSNVTPGSNLKGGIRNMVSEISASGLHYLVDFFDREILFISGTTVGYSAFPNANGSVVINYEREVPIVKFGQDNASISMFGPKSLVIQDKSIKDPLTAQAILFDKLSKVNPLNEYELDIDGWFSLTPGQTINVNLSDFNINNLTSSILNVDYRFDKNTIQSENVMSLTLNNKPLDITDEFREVKRRIEALESADKSATDLLTRFEFGLGSFDLVGSRWEVRTSTVTGSAYHLYSTNFTPPVNPFNLASGVSQGLLAGSFTGSASAFGPFITQTSGGFNYVF